jgi:pyridoxal phosphate enzyme (YggS family)
LNIAARLEEVRERIAVAAERSGRGPDRIRLVAVSKYRTVDEIREAVRAGVTDIGENRVQEAEEKRRILGGAPLTWHLVGHLQSNKAKRALAVADVIHSVDGVALARRLDRLAREEEKRQRALVQVDLAGEESKFGLPARELSGALEQMTDMEHLQIEGLMTLPPYFTDTEDVRPYFSRLRVLRDEAHRLGLLSEAARELSMGMSHDYEVAIEEGATIVRIGTAIFGERPRVPPPEVGGARQLHEEGR